MVATYAHTMPPGHSASAAASRHSHGASMSRMIRSARSPEAGQRLGEVADGELPGRVGLPSGAPKNCSTLRRATSANSSRRSYDVHPAERADGAQQRAGQRAGADARLDDVGAGEDVGERDDLGGVLRVDDRGAARHRDDELREQRPEDEVLAAGRRGDREALLAADQVVVRHAAAVGVEASCPASRQMLCRRPLPSSSRTHSPSRSGPRWTPDQASVATSGASDSAARGCFGTCSGVSDTPGTLVAALLEGPIDVGRRQHAEDGAVLARRAGTPTPGGG